MTIIVYGEPAPQGSKRHVGRGIMVESSKKVAPWREAVKWAAVEAMSKLGVAAPAIAGPVSLGVMFYLTKPKNAKRFALPDKKYDIDKLLRSTCDALTDAGVWEDDGRIVDVQASKLYAVPGTFGLDRPGAFIRVEAKAINQ